LDPEFDAYSRPDELLAVVDENDVEIGGERRDVIHRMNLLHRAIHLIVTNSRGEILIQKRSSLKDTYPLHWECVGGHLAPGEQYEAAALREIREELGIEVPEVHEVGKLKACSETGWEFITVFLARTDMAPNPNAGEVIATEWIIPQALERELAESDSARGRRRLFSPSFVHTLRQTNVLSMLAQGAKGLFGE